MISFLLCLALLIIGYFVYGKIVDNTFGPDDRETPAVHNGGAQVTQLRYMLCQVFICVVPRRGNQS